MKKIIITTVVLILAWFFFLFTAEGNGLIELVNNLIKGDPQIPTINEVVMPANARIEATTPEGTITIKSGTGLKRFYSWDGATRSVVMWPRPSRWFGSLGMYYPGPGFHWLPHKGIKRGVLNEGQKHFNTAEEAVRWLSQRNNNDCVYRDDGLAVCFSKNLNRYQLNVDVWQIYVEGITPSAFKETATEDKNTTYYVGGHKPGKLEGSHNDLIRASWDLKK
jgi:hypothetical protein